MAKIADRPIFECGDPNCVSRLHFYTDELPDEPEGDD